MFSAQCYRSLNWTSNRVPVGVSELEERVRDRINRLYITCLSAVSRHTYNQVAEPSAFVSVSRRRLFWRQVSGYDFSIIKWGEGSPNQTIRSRYTIYILKIPEGWSKPPLLVTSKPLKRRPWTIFEKEMSHRSLQACMDSYPKRTAWFIRSLQRRGRSPKCEVSIVNVHKMHAWRRIGISRWTEFCSVPVSDRQVFR